VATFAAFFDANVLYPAELRNFLMHLALTGLFRAKWSAAVHEEWISNLLRKRPDLTRAQLERTRSLMDKHAIDSVVTGYEDLIPALHLRDPNDRHVLAAAIRGGADIIVTMNLRDFPAEATSVWGIEAIHPDEFILQLFGISTEAVLSAARSHREALRNPPRDAAEYINSLERQGLRQSAALLRKYINVI
jgi:predicted nucleic acid-binding protein